MKNSAAKKLRQVLVGYPVVGVEEALERVKIEMVRTGCGGLGHKNKLA